jgi:hypothetical protein
MLFKPELVAKILAGEKTQTRRVKRDEDTAWHEGVYPQAYLPIVRVYRSGRLLWQVGHSYALQPGYAKAAVGRILIESIRHCARASDISESDAVAEGFSSVSDFRALYSKINGAESLGQPCWALSFDLINVEEPE